MMNTQQETKLSFLNQFLTLWIFFAMAFGILLGYVFPEITEVLDKVSIGTTSIPIAIGLILSANISNPLNKISEILNKSSGQIASASTQLSSSSQEIANGATEQASSIEETTSSMEELASMVKQKNW